MKVCVRMIVLTYDAVFNFFFVYLDKFNYTYSVEFIIEMDCPLV